MKRLLLLLIIATTTAALAGCDKKPEPPSNVTINVTGEIKGALTGNLIEESVLLNFDDKPYTVSNGTFTLQSIKAGPHTLRVEHSGFLKYEKTVTLKAGSHLEIALITTSAPTVTSWGIAYDPGDLKIHNGQIYLPSYDAIWRWSLDGTSQNYFAPTSTNYSSITFDDAGVLWGASEERGDVFYLDSTGKNTLIYPALGVFYDGGNPHGLAVDETYIYLCIWRTSTIRKFRRADGALVAEIGIADDEALKQPARLIFGPDGYLYAAVFDRIVVLTKDLSVLRTFSTTVDGETQSWVSTMAFGPDGYLYVSDTCNDNFKKFGPDGSFIQKIPISPLPEFYIRGLAFDDSGTLYAANDSIRGDWRIYAFSWSY